MNRSDKSYKLIAMHLVSVALSFLYSVDSYPYTSNTANYALNVHFNTKKKKHLADDVFALCNPDST